MEKTKAFIKKKKSLFGYFFAAGSGVIVQYLVGTFICIRYFGMPFKTGVAIGYIVSVPVGFILTKIFAFEAKKSGNTNREMLKFLIVLIFSFLITTFGADFSLKTLTYLFGDIKTNIPFTNEVFSPIGTISHFAGMGMSFVFNYFTHKKFTFVETGLFEKVKSIKKS